MQFKAGTFVIDFRIMYTFESGNFLDFRLKLKYNINVSK